MKLSAKDREVANAVLKEIEDRLTFLLNVGLEYLSLNRTANTLSGGEAQRIRLASQLGSRLVGAMYVLDEPTIGLHQRDNERLIKTLEDLRDAGNTIIVVEHDEDTIFASDYISRYWSWCWYSRRRGYCFWLSRQTTCCQEK